MAIHRCPNCGRIWDARSCFACGYEATADAPSTPGAGIHKIDSLPDGAPVSSEQARARPSPPPAAQAPASPSPAPSAPRPAAPATIAAPPPGPPPAWVGQGAPTPRAAPPASAEVAAGPRPVSALSNLSPLVDALDGGAADPFAMPKTASARPPASSTSAPRSTGAGPAGAGPDGAPPAAAPPAAPPPRSTSLGDDLFADVQPSVPMEARHPLTGKIPSLASMGMSLPPQPAEPPLPPLEEPPAPPATADAWAGAGTAAESPPTGDFFFDIDSDVVRSDPGPADLEAPPTAPGWPSSAPVDDPTESALDLSFSVEEGAMKPGAPVPHDPNLEDTGIREHPKPPAPFDDTMFSSGVLTKDMPAPHGHRAEDLRFEDDLGGGFDVPQTDATGSVPEEPPPDLGEDQIPTLSHAQDYATRVGLLAMKLEFEGRKDDAQLLYDVEALLRSMD